MYAPEELSNVHTDYRFQGIGNFRSLPGGDLTLDNLVGGKSALATLRLRATWEAGDPANCQMTQTSSTSETDEDSDSDSERARMLHSEWASTGGYERP